MSVNWSRWRHGVAVLALLIAGCSADSDKPLTPAPSPYAAVARGRVDVEGGLIALGAPREGTVRTVSAREGLSVRHGDVLLELDDTATRLAVDAAEAELKQAKAEVEVLSGQATAAAARAQRLLAAAKAGAGEGQAADDAQALATQLSAQHEVAAAVVASATVKRAAALHELSLHALRAPQDAEVVRVTAQPGVTVSPQGGALITLLPLTPRIVRAELSETYTTAVRVGMAATVTAEDDPTHGWPAQVLRISAVVGPAVLEEDPQRRAAERTVECVLTLDKAAALRV